MQEFLLNVFENCYKHSSSLVLIMDLHWRVLWSNRPYSLASLPELLDISPSHTGNTTHHFSHNGRLFECRLLCNPEEQFRIAEIVDREEESRTILPMDFEAVSASVQSMTMACTALSNTLDEFDLKSERALLNMMIGNCYRIYRTAYLQKELDRLHDNNRRTEFFQVKTALQIVWERMRMILRDCIQIKLLPCDEAIFLKGDLEEFMMMVLSAAILCCHDSDHFQELTIGLELRDGLVHLQLQAEETPSELERNPQKVLIPLDKGMEGEKAILQMFCKRHDGKWMFLESSQTNSRSCSIQFRASKDEGDSLTLHSTRDQQEGKIFNKYKIMLSCIYYQDVF